ncbi:hypothetical protein JCM10003_3549 [Bacteroides pyogenes JCM 10003]|nr:hypothetical protein JCM10003_3549 [Bacteroides pyogenes JCM 10003]
MPCNYPAAIPAGRPAQGRAARYAEPVSYVRQLTGRRTQGRAVRPLFCFPQKEKEAELMQVGERRFRAGWINPLHESAFARFRL